MNNKRILLVGKETFMYPFYFLVDRWEKENTIASFWINQHESELDECHLNRTTYYAFKEKGIIEYSLHEAVVHFSEKINNQSLDYDILHEMEENNSFFKNFNCQIVSDQVMSINYHYRNFHQAPTYEQQLIWISCIYINIEKILDDFKPDVIFDCDIAELPRTVLNEIAYRRNIPYISPAYPRYEMHKIPSYSLNQGMESYFVEAYKKNLLKLNEEEKKYVLDFRKRKNIKNKMFLEKGNSTYSYFAEPFIDTAKKIYGRWTYFIEQDKPKKNKQLKKENPILFVSSSKYMRFWIKYNLFRRKLYKTKTLFEDPVDGEPYVYIALHLIPESTTFSMAPFWINELSVIEAVSKSVPAGWRVYVKEHQAMLGERGMDFYKRVRAIPNVRLVRFNYYDDPKPWIEKAKAVVTITGTAAYEAALLGKPAFVFGDVPFGVIKGVTRIKNIEDLPGMFRNLGKIDNLNECAAYIKTVKDVGEPINLNYIMNTAYAYLTRNEKLTEQFWDEIDHLQKFFENAFENKDRFCK